MNNRTRILVGVWVLLLWAAGAPAEHSGGLRMEGERLHVGDQPFRVRGVYYEPRRAAGSELLPAVDCQLARDLPLIAAAGANTVRTNGIGVGNEPVLRSVLETAGLYWVAGFSLEPYYDPDLSIQAKKTEILGDLRGFAERHLGNERLIAIVIGEEVSAGYERKFAGRPEEFYELLSEATALLRGMRPEAPVLVATAVRNAAEMERVVPGLGFWIWKAGSWDEAGAQAGEAVSGASAPVLIEGFAAPGAQEPSEPEEEDGSPAAAAMEVVREWERDETGLGFVWAQFSAPEAKGSGTELFRSSADEESWETLAATEYYEALAELWQGRRRDEWRMEAPAELNAVVHAASGAETVAAGGLARIEGRELAAHTYAANGVPWPLHQGETCVCAGGTPLPMGMISREGGTVLIPWEMAAGEQEVLYYRTGKAAGPVKVWVAPLAPGIFQDSIHREDPACMVSGENGVRPGERLTLFGTGFGPGAPLETQPRVWVNGQEAEVLYAGLELAVPGLARIDIRVDPATRPSEQGVLVVRTGEAPIFAAALRVESPAGRGGVRLRMPGQEVVVQAGGTAVSVPVQVEGLRGYCGAARVEARGLPAGVAATVGAGWIGEAVQVNFQAAADALPQKGVEFVVYAEGEGAEPFALTARITVLPSRGLIPVSAFSNGYRSGYPRAQFRWDGQLIFDTTGGGPGRGINVLTADPKTGVFSAVRSFDTWGDENASAELAAYLESLPDGTLALFAVADEGSRLLSPAARAAIAKMFFSRYIWVLDYQESWALIGRKGMWPFSENWSRGWGIAAFTNVQFPMHW